MFSNSYIGLVLFLLNFSSDVNGQASPEARCADLVDGNICINCYQYQQCVSGLLVTSSTTSCTTEKVCDDSIADGICITPATSEISPICFCKEQGCFVDPNDSDLYWKCTSTNRRGTQAPDPTSPCNYPSEQFNTQTCNCDIIDCPPCSFIPEDNSNCSTTYYYCSDPAVTNPFYCDSGMCFNVPDCHCEGVVIPCPTCGKYPDPDSTDNRGFCFCDDMIVSPVCGAVCIPGTVFNEVTCQCTATT